MSAVVIHCQYRIPAEIREKWLESAWNHTFNSRKEQGCLGFAYSFDAWEPEIAYVYQKWESWEAMKAHEVTAHHDKRTADLKQIEGVTYEEIVFYKVAEEIDMLEAARPR